jgi:DNA-binding CsgD family transcriptional regulator
MNNLNPNSLAKKVNALDPAKILKEETVKKGINFLIHFGGKCFFSSGSVSGGSTNKEWNAFTNKPEILKTCVKSHYFRYLKLMNNTNFRYQIRRKEDVDTEFLGYLSDFEMCNSLTVYVKYPGYVKTYFFVAAPNDKVAINFFYNHLYLFEEIIKNTERRISQESYIKRILEIHRGDLFSIYDRRLLFEGNIEGLESLIKNFFHKGKEIKLTEQELELLKIIEVGDTLKDLASKMSLRVSGIQYHLNNLTKKTNINNKREIAQLAISLQELN